MAGPQVVIVTDTDALDSLYIGKISPKALEGENRSAVVFVVDFAAQ